MILTKRINGRQGSAEAVNAFLLSEGINERDVVSIKTAKDDPWFIEIWYIKPDVPKQNIPPYLQKIISKIDEDIEGERKLVEDIGYEEYERVVHHFTLMGLTRARQIICEETTL